MVCAKDQDALKDTETLFATGIQGGGVLQFPGAGVRRDEQKQKETDRSLFQEREGARKIRKVQNRKTCIKPVR
jgi:hypothetical protein